MQQDNIAVTPTQIHNSPICVPWIVMVTLPVIPTQKSSAAKYTPVVIAKRSFVWTVRNSKSTDIKRLKVYPPYLLMETTMMASKLNANVCNEVVFCLSQGDGKSVLFDHYKSTGSAIFVHQNTTGNVLFSSIGI